ncbi:MAG: hypothetical protein IK104_00635 [Clostridia bacterium]|nr:hypothetical protein [Clostridia bacterium]
MKPIAKKSLALLLSLVLAFAGMLSVTALTAENERARYYPSIVIPGIFQSDVRWYDENGNEMLKSDGTPYERPFYLEDTDAIVKDALENALAPVAKMLILQKDKEEKAAKAIAEVVGRTVAGRVQCDEHGHFINNIKAVPYNTSLANLSDYDREFALDAIPLRAYVEKAGLENLYFYSFASLGSIKELAEGLYDLIQIAKEETGMPKVNLAPISQGGTIFAALMQLYKDRGLKLSDDVHRVCLVVPASDGAAVFSDLYVNGFVDDPEALYSNTMTSIFDDDQDWLAYLINLLLRYFPNADLNNILDLTVYTLIEDYLENSTALWAIVSSKDYPIARERFLMDDDNVYIREETDWFHAAQAKTLDYILEAREEGVEFFDIVDYNFALYAIGASWNKVNADGVIHTESESLGAYSVPPMESLPDDYVQKNTYCTDPSHNHIDPHRKVDASAGILPENTFYFYGQQHTTTASNDVIIRLASRILWDDTFTDIYSDPGFPQFNYARSSRKLINLYNAWKDYDASGLDADLAARFAAAMDDAKAAVESTYMPTEEHEAVYQNLKTVTDEISGNTPDLQTRAKDGFMKVLTKILRFFSDLMLKVLGGKGYSDVFRVF